jgi:hypothetical protein
MDCMQNWRLAMRMCCHLLQVSQLAALLIKAAQGPVWSFS